MTPGGGYGPRFPLTYCHLSAPGDREQMIGTVAEGTAVSAYKDREILSVAVRSIEPSDNPTDLRVGVHVEIILKDAVGPGFGPSMTFGFGFPVEPDESLASMRERAIERALDLARRVSAEDLQSLLRVANTPPDYY